MWVPPNEDAVRVLVVEQLPAAQHQGPGAPAGIVEGVITTKDYVTYWDAQAPVGGVDANRTIFHIR